MVVVVVVKDFGRQRLNGAVGDVVFVVVAAAAYDDDDEVHPLQW